MKPMSKPARCIEPPRPWVPRRLTVQFGHEAIGDMPLAKAWVMAAVGGRDGCLARSKAAATPTAVAFLAQPQGAHHQGSCPA